MPSNHRKKNGKIQPVKEQPLIRPELQSYVEKNIFPRYEACDKAHRMPHVDYVIRRSLMFAKDVPDADPEIAYVTAAYHDLGCAVDRKTHNLISAEIVRNDEALKGFFSQEQIATIVEAVEDHRASNKTPPPSIYGKIVASADKPATLDVVMNRVWEYREAQLAEKGLDWVVDDAYDHAKGKYGSGGYSPNSMFFPDPEYKEMLSQMKDLTSDKRRFRKALLEAVGVEDPQRGSESMIKAKDDQNFSL